MLASCRPPALHGGTCPCPPSYGLACLTARPQVKIFPFPSGCGSGVDSQPPTAGTTTCRLYQVKQTDSIDTVARRFGQTVTDVVTMNPELTDPSLLTPGSKIKISPWDDSCFDGVLVPGTPLSDTSSRRLLRAA